MQHLALAVAAITTTSMLAQVPSRSRTAVYQDRAAAAPCLTPVYTGPPEGNSPLLYLPWTPAAAVNVFIDSRVTNPELVTQVLAEALLVWQARNGPCGTNSDMTFLRPVIKPWTPCAKDAPCAECNAIGIIEADPKDPTRAIDPDVARVNHVGSREANTKCQATIYFQPGIPSREALRRVLIHEIGHVLGLPDCSTCPIGTTAMVKPRPCSSVQSCAYDQLLDAPTPCDLAAIRKLGNYRSWRVPGPLSGPWVLSTTGSLGTCRSECTQICPRGTCSPQTFTDTANLMAVVPVCQDGGALTLDPEPPPNSTPGVQEAWALRGTVDPPDAVRPGARITFEFSIQRSGASATCSSSSRIWLQGSGELTSPTLIQGQADWGYLLNAQECLGPCQPGFTTCSARSSFTVSMPQSRLPF